MATWHATNTAARNAALNVMAPGDTLYLHGGVYGALDSETQRIQGGTSWGTKLTIKAYRNEHVAFRGSPFPLRLTHSVNAYVQVGTPENPIELDGQRTATHCAKVTEASATDGAHHVRLYLDCHDALHSGVLVTDAHHVELYGRSHDNGWSTDPQDFNKDHNAYLGAGAWDCTFIFDGWGAGAYSIHEYGGEESGKCGRNVFGGFHYDNGRLAPRAGILLGGTGSKAEHVMSTRNVWGVEIYHTARGCSFGGYLEGNRAGRVYVDPGAVGTVERA